MARALRDAGMEVVYTGLHKTPEEVVAAAVQEDVDVVGISLLSGAHMTLVPKVLKLLRDKEASDIMVVAGGVFSDDDANALREMGVAEVMGQDTPPPEIVRLITTLVEARKPR